MQFKAHFFMHQSLFPLLENEEGSKDVSRDLRYNLVALMGKLSPKVL